MLAKTYSSVLRQAGHKVTWRTSGQKGIEASDKQTPDLIILELQLAGHNGLEFLYELRSYNEWQNLPVIVLSHVPPHTFKDSVAWPLVNVQAYLYKPTTKLKKLVEIIENIQQTVPV